MGLGQEPDLGGLVRHIERIEQEVAQLQKAAGGASEQALAAGRIEGAARRLQQKLEEDQDTSELWLLLQDPGRNMQASQIQRSVDRTLEAMLRTLDPAGVTLGTASLAGRVQAIQERCEEIAGSRPIRRFSLPPPAKWRHAAGVGQADPWSSLVMLSGVILDFIHALTAGAKKDEQAQ